MFLVYINDLAILLSHYIVRIKLFVGDVKLHANVVSILQMLLICKWQCPALVDWADYWQYCPSLEYRRLMLILSVE